MTVGRRGNIFVAKFDAGGAQPFYITRLSSSFGGEGGYGIALDAAGDALVAGGSNSGSGFPTTANAFQKIPVAASTLSLR